MIWGNTRKDKNTSSERGSEASTHGAKRAFQMCSNIPIAPWAEDAWIACGLLACGYWCFHTRIHAPCQEGTRGFWKMFSHNEEKKNDLEGTRGFWKQRKIEIQVGTRNPNWKREVFCIALLAMICNFLCCQFASEASAHSAKRAFQMCWNIPIAPWAEGAWINCGLLKTAFSHCDRRKLLMFRAIEREGVSERILTLLSHRGLDQKIFHAPFMHLARL